MPELLKNIYNPEFFELFTSIVKKAVPGFNGRKFIQSVLCDEWENYELKQRMRQISTCLNDHLSGSYPDKINQIMSIIEKLRKSGIKENSIEYMFFPDFIEQYGLDNLNTSLKAMEFVTQFTSCEFAIRPFIKKHTEQVLKQMLKWSMHESHLVRRFASEGCRPRLPWAMALPSLKNDPLPIIPILENLKNDPSEFVRRSVANNLNDIAKDNPEVVIQLAKKWKGLSKETDWVIKHGCRTLLKKANNDIYDLFGLSSSISCKVTDLQLDKSSLKIGETLKFAFCLQTGKGKECKLRIEYVVYFMKANGKPSKKLFKITENVYEGGKVYTFTRNQSFKNLTTRKHYPGQHKIGVVINGKELMVKEFMLK